MPIAQILSIEKGGSWENRQYGGTMYEFLYTFPGDVQVKANHKKETGVFQVGDEVEYTITRESDSHHPHDGRVGKPQGNFQNSRPAAPSANSSPPSSNGYADRDKSIRDAVIYKEAAAFLRANPQAGMAKCVRTARALMEIVECADIPQDTPAPESLSQVAADSEIPF